MEWLGIETRGERRERRRDTWGVEGIGRYFNVSFSNRVDESGKEMHRGACLSITFSPMRFEIPF
jgi:hypothetical protein